MSDAAAVVVRVIGNGRRKRQLRRRFPSTKPCSPLKLFISQLRRARRCPNYNVTIDEKRRALSLERASEQTNCVFDRSLAIGRRKRLELFHC